MLGATQCLLLAKTVSGCLSTSAMLSACGFGDTLPIVRGGLTVYLHVFPDKPLPSATDEMIITSVLGKFKLPGKLAGMLALLRVARTINSTRYDSRRVVRYHAPCMRMPTGTGGVLVASRIKWVRKHPF